MSAPAVASPVEVTHCTGRLSCRCEPCRRELLIDHAVDAMTDHEDITQAPETATALGNWIRNGRRGERPPIKRS